MSRLDDQLMADIHEIASDLHSIGKLDKHAMEWFEAQCQPGPASQAKPVRNLRSRNRRAQTTSLTDRAAA